MKKRATTKSRKTASPVVRIVRLSSDQLIVVQHAAKFLIASHKRLHWDMVALMGREPREMSEQLKMTARLASEVAKIEDAMQAVNRMFESQFE